MDKKDLPQYESDLKDMTREVVYVKDENGHYTKELSSGWEVKTKALNHAWEEIERRKEYAKQQIEDGVASPILFYMEEFLMDRSILAGYTGFWQWQIKRHLKAKNFKKLSQKKLAKYAGAFDIDIETLKNIERYIGK